MVKPGSQAEHVGRLILAVIVVLALPALPFGNYLTYPFVILTTWFHEMGHGLTAMALGQARGRRPILVGGTMLYLKALLEGMDPLPAADPALRARLTERAECDGWPVLHAELARLDPDAADAIHPNHSQRLLRALELVMLSGKPLSELHSRQQGTSPSPANPGVAPALTFALVPADRKQLHQRIEQRFDAMMEAGFLAEVKQLRNQPGLSEALPAIRAVGYRQLWRHL